MLARWATQIEFFPMANSRHQLDPQQIRQTKNGGALTLGVGVDGIGPHIGFILLDKIQDVMSLPGTARREGGKQREVGVSYEIISDAAVTAVANVVFRHQVLRIQFPLRTIR